MNREKGCSCLERPIYPEKVKAVVDGLERVISFMPGINCEVGFHDPKSGKNHGKHGTDLVFLLKGPKGVIQFLIYTGWLVEGREIGFKSRQLFDVIPADISYHSPIKQCKDQQTIGSCRWLDGKDCYYEGSSLQAYEVFEIFVSAGEEALWAEMKNRYDGLLEK